MVKQKEAEVHSRKYEVSSEDFSNAFMNDEIRLVRVGGDSEDPLYNLRDMRSPQIYAPVSLPGDDYLHLNKVRARAFHSCGIVPFPGLEQSEWLAIIGRKADEGKMERIALPDYSLERLILESSLRF